MWWILGFMTAVAVVGYVAYKYPTWFGLAVKSGADVVNNVDNQIKNTLNNNTK